MEADLLRAIRERPDDDDPRLVFADWLTDQGDPRGEFIVLQCKLARMDRDDDERRWMEVRRRELLDAHGAAWRRGLDAIPTLSSGYLERGFVRRVALDEAVFVERASALFAAAPLLEEVYLRGSTWSAPPGVPPELARLRSVTFGSTPFALAALASPHLQAVERLAFERECDGRRIVAAIARTRLDRLESLELGGTELGDAGLQALLAWSGLARLRRLDVSRCGLSRVRELATSPHVAALSYLNLWDNPLGARGATDVVSSNQLVALEELRLHATNAAGALAHCRLPKLATLLYGENPLAADEGAAIAAATLPSLVQLDLHGHNRELPTVDAAAAAAIVASPSFPQLTSIDLQQNRYGPAAASIIRAMREGFRTIGLAWTDLDEDGVRALAEHPQLATVERLDLSNNPIDHAAIRMLAASPYLRPRYLHLGYTQIGDKGIATLARSPVCAALRHLDLQGCKLGDAAAKSLARSPHLGHLTRLVLYNNRLTDAGAGALAASKKLPPLVELALGSNEISAAGLQALAARGHGLR